MSNNKQSMKLYTEEQVMNALKLAHSHIKPLQYVVDTLTPIELPTDEEIGKGRDEHIPINEIDMWSERLYFTLGAKWLRDKIQGGNK